MAHSSDFLIVGGGIAGSSLAYHLAPHGSVTILEMEKDIGYHTTGRSAAFYAESYGETPIRYLTSESKSFLQNPPRGFTDSPLLTQRGALHLFTEEQSASAENIFADMKAMIPTVEMVSADKVREQVPYITADFSGAIWDPDCGDLDVSNLHQSFLRSAKKNGANLHLDVALQMAVRRGGRWSVLTNIGAFDTKILINCAGAWADEVAALSGAETLGMMPLRRTIINIEAENVCGNGPLVIDIDDTYYIKPEPGSYLVSPCDETLSEPCDAQPEELDIAYAAHYFTEATGIEVRRVGHSWAGLRTFAPDHAPVIGFDAVVDDFFWSVGQGGYGIQTAPAWGEAAATMLLTGDLPTSLKARGATKALYDPARFRS